MGRHDLDVVEDRLLLSLHAKADLSAHSGRVRHVEHGPIVKLHRGPDALSDHGQAVPLAGPRGYMSRGHDASLGVEDADELKPTGPSAGAVDR